MQCNCSSLIAYVQHVYGQKFVTLHIHKFVLSIMKQRIRAHAINHRAPFVHEFILVHEKHQYVPAGAVAA